MLKGMTGRDIKLGLSLVKLFLARCLYWGSTLDDYPVSILPRVCRIVSLTASVVQDAAFTKLLTLNLQRVFTLTQKCLPLLRAAAEQGGKWDDVVYKDPARIINVSVLYPITLTVFLRHVHRSVL